MINPHKCNKCKGVFNSVKEYRITAVNVLGVDNQIRLGYISEDLPRQVEKLLFNTKGKHFTLRLCTTCDFIVKKEVIGGKIK